ncbi:Uncharacterised protein [Escherichia coli]|nr:Uncharacterised protein [Escherichia coli]SQP08919.1 Uncharacterised protein [Escherichia coli]SQZ59373.1 Uncharacterised protein [Escherichia coli]SQZ93978.1 Uncharacterised protein [Escherichia coli]
MNQLALHVIQVLNQKGRWPQRISPWLHSQWFGLKHYHQLMFHRYFR